MFSACSGTLSLRARCVSSGSRWTTHWRWRSRQRFHGCEACARAWIDSGRGELIGDKLEDGAASMSDGILLALAVLVPTAAAIRWIRRGADFGTACWIYCLTSIPIWLIIALWIKEPSHSVLYDLAYGFAVAIMGGGMGTLVCFVPGWLICSGTKGLFEEKALLRSAGKLLLGLFLYGFWTLAFFATKGQ